MELDVKNFIAMWDNAVSNEYCDQLIEWWNQSEMTVVSDPSKQVFADTYDVRDGGKANGAKNRKDVSYFLEKTGSPEIQKPMIDAIRACVAEYQQHYPNLESYHLYSYEIKVQKTPPHGGYHVWHHEHSTDSSMSRILTWTLYLNDIPEGEGETEFLYQGMKVQPKKGRFCLFPAGFTHLHRGNPPYSCDKYIATGWIKCREA